MDWVAREIRMRSVNKNIIMSNLWDRGGQWIGYMCLTAGVDISVF